MKNEKLSRLFLRFNGGGPVGYTQAMPGQLPQYQTGADLNGVDLKTRQDFEHYYGGKYPILAEGGDTDMDGDDQSFYTNKVNTFIKGIQETAQKNLLKEIMREAQGQNEEKEYSDEEVIQAAYGMSFNQRPNYGNSLYDPGNMKLFSDAANTTGNLKNAFKEFGMSKYRNPDKYYTKMKTKFDTGFSDIFKEKNPVYTYGEMGYGGGLDEYQGDKNSSTTANQTGTGVTEDKNNGFRTKVINGKLYAIGPDGRLYAAEEAEKPETKTFRYTNRNKLTPEFAEAMKKGTYLDTRLLGPPVIEEKGFGPFKRNVTTWQYGKLSGDPYATNNNVTTPRSTTVPGSTTQKKTTIAPVNSSASTLTPEQKIQKAMDWTFRPGQGPYNTEPDFPGLEKPRVGPWDVDNNPIGITYPNKDQSTFNRDPNNVIGIPYPNKDQNTFNRDPNNIGGTPYSNVDPSGNQLPPGYVWDAGLNTAVMNSSANTGTNTPINEPSVQKEGGTILPIFQGMIGPSTFTDMAEEDPEEGADYGPIIDPTTGKPLESKIFSSMTDADRINALDAGTEYDKSNDPNTFFAENPFNVEQISKRKRLYDPNRTIRNMGLATAFFSQDERLANKRKLSEASQASSRYNDAPSFYGNDIVNTGKRMIGDGSGVPVFNAGYAQMGGSILDNIKEGDEVYLTEEQINDIIKRGGKLSYL